MQDERNREQKQKLIIVMCPIEPPYPLAFDNKAHQHYQEGTDKDPQVKRIRPIGDGECEIGAKGIECAMGKVGDIEDAQHDGQADADHRIQHARGQTVQNLACNQYAHLNACCLFNQTWKKDEQPPAKNQHRRSVAGAGRFSS